MWLKAQEDGMTYYCGDVKYQKDIGMVNINNGSNWPLNAWANLDRLMKIKWEVGRTMTRSEVEKQLHIKIID